MKFIIFGSNGQLGRCIKSELKASENEIFMFSKTDLDITQHDDLVNIVHEVCPDVIINASAYTAVDQAEANENMADLVNNEAVGNIASICKDLGCLLIHISTDYVFDGSSSKPYKESDIPNPNTVYGLTKLKGEIAIQSSNCNHIILRTAWVFSEFGNNFLKTMLSLKDENKLKIIDDQLGCPTYARDLAKTILIIANEYDSNDPISGIFHYCGDSECSWYDFAKEIFNQASSLDIAVPATIEKVSSSEYITAAKRPSYSVLECKKIFDYFKIPKSNWRSGIKSSLNYINTN